MDYRMYDLGSYKLHTVKTDKFKETKIIINFKRKVKKEEITIRSLITKILLESSQNYPTSRLMTIKTEDLYNLIFSSSSYLSGNYSVVSFTTTFLGNKWAGEDIFEDAVDFYLDVLMNPNINNNKFDEKAFDLAKKSLKDEIDTLKDIPSRYGIQRLFEEIDKNSVSTYNATGYSEDLDLITPSSLADYYNSILKSDLIDIFVISPNDHDYIKEVFNKRIKLNIFKKTTGSHFVAYDKYRKRNKIVHEKSEFNQSKLYVGCKFDKLTDFELKYVSTVYSYILGGGPSSLLFETVREKNSLCYSISSSLKSIYYYLVISAGINAKDFKKCLRLIKKQIKRMNNGEFDDAKIEEAKLTYLNSFKELKDSPSSILGTIISHEYIGADLIDEREKQIGKVTKEMIVEFAHKLHVDTVYVLEGNDKDE